MIFSIWRKADHLESLPKSASIIYVGAGGIGLHSCGGPRFNLYADHRNSLAFAINLAASDLL